MKTVKKIEVTRPTLPTRKRVAAYARVSMESDRMMHSLSTQVSYYNEFIQSNPEWEFAGVYADNFISGTSTNKRTEFQRMMADCEAGKIDIVLTKSISRFARNTVDLLETVRHLKELGIEVQFEKERINSLSDDGELMLSLLASFAQEESRSISENIRWATQKRFEQGIPNGKFRVYGYRWEDNLLVPVPEEAAIVKRIFQNFLDGKSRLETEREFAAEGITTREGCRWVDSNIKVVLSNITYTGNLLLQKEFIEDPITKNRRKNKGQLPQYFVENTHEAIIDMETFQYVQDEMARRRELGALANKSLNICCFTGKIKCPHCGLSYMHNRRKSRNEEYWNCGSKKKKKVGDGCPVKGIITQKALEKACCEVLDQEDFDEAVFLDKVDHIEVPLRSTLDFFLKDGQVIRKDAPNTGHKDCWTKEYREATSVKRLKQGTNPKGASCFTAKIKCPACGCNFRRSVSTCASGEKVPYWRCSDFSCNTKGLREDWLKAMVTEVLDLKEFESDAVTDQIDHIDVLEGTELAFYLKDGRMIKRQWRKKRHSHKCTEAQKAHMSEVMKKQWTPERREAFGNFVREYRREHYWSSTGKSKRSQQP